MIERLTVIAPGCNDSFCVSICFIVLFMTIIKKKERVR